MFSNQKRKVSIFGLLCGVFIAVTVYCNNTVSVFGNNRTFRIHTKCTN